MERGGAEEVRFGVFDRMPTKYKELLHNILISLDFLIFVGGGRGG